VLGARNIIILYSSRGNEYRNHRVRMIGDDDDDDDDDDNNIIPPPRRSRPYISMF